MTSFLQEHAFDRSDYDKFYNRAKDIVEDCNNLKELILLKHKK